MLFKWIDSNWNWKLGLWNLHDLLKLWVVVVVVVEYSQEHFGGLRTVTQKEEKNQSSNLLADFRLPACKLQVWYTQLYLQVYCLAFPTQAARN